jgi:hypothetical protein
MRTLTGLLLAIALGTEGLAAEPWPMACASSEEAGAITIRAMQARLMVSAISCGGEASYNLVVARFGQQLAAAYRGSEAFWVRTAEAGGRSLWNQHDVALAAHWSDTLARRGPDRCVAELQMFDEILRPPPDRHASRSPSG